MHTASHSPLISPPPHSLTPNRIRAPTHVRFGLRPVSIRSKGPIRVSSPSSTSSPMEATEEEVDGFVAVANKVADAAGEVIRKYFRQKFDILDKDDLSPVTIADRNAEESMVSIILEKFPSHAIFGEENGWRCKEESADYVWVLDPIDGTKSFITGKPLFGTLIALLHKGKPTIGIIDQPILKERWIGMTGRRTTLNGREVSTRPCSKLSEAYMYTTSPHLFNGEAEEAFIRVRNEVKVPLYGCDCYAYALLASGFVDLVIESGLKPYDFLSLVPVIEGAGGSITDWKGNNLKWEASSNSSATSFNVAAAGDPELHKKALEMLQWK
ncbi:bifunctional phosphatase IMPL2, chloroplastic-like [Asparagus officinalis]|uniref:bifunctional phosphatase IMPL2, chloroplastic-like n=1 Tax=Asparagus officinalis TaxID=4686 RepID=UPI00098DFC02|nr:bifunctional phosphatase IMPL2, chloroplastic-like [Asparagus officinalis]